MVARIIQCCCQGLETQGRGQGQGVKLQGQGQGLENWSSRILEDKDFPRIQQHCNAGSQINARVF